jgi:hypothetical protein
MIVHYIEVNQVRAGAHDRGHFVTRRAKSAERMLGAMRYIGSLLVFVTS